MRTSIAFGLLVIGLLLTPAALTAAAGVETVGPGLIVVHGPVNGAILRRNGKALAVSHFSYPVPTRAHLRLQVFSDLAYGAPAIQYFTSLPFVSAKLPTSCG